MINKREIGTSNGVIEHRHAAYTRRVISESKEDNDVTLRNVAFATWRGRESCNILTPLK